MSSGASDLVVFSGSGGAVVVDLGAGEISDAGWPEGWVAFQGVELLEVEAAGGGVDGSWQWGGGSAGGASGRSSGRLAAAGGSGAAGQLPERGGQSADGRRWRRSGCGGRLRQPGGG